MAEDLERLKRTTDLVSVIGSRVQLTRRGHEFVGLCPFHDENTPSFTVAPDKGFYHCFGCGANGDAIDFLRDLDGLSFKEAVATLKGERFAPIPVKEHWAPRQPRSQWKTELPPTTDPEPRTFYLARYNGEPSKIWTYRTRTGDVMGYVARYDIATDGAKKKVTPQWTFGRDESDQEGAPHWECRHFTPPRPLYGLELLDERPSAQIILVEGEKTCDAARTLFPGKICMTWPGGAQATKNVDWSPLYHWPKEIILIPDNDQPGRDAMRYIAALLYGNGCRLRFVMPEETRPDGWDLADAVADHWTEVVALQWAREHCQDYVPTVKAEPEKPAAKGKGNLSLVTDEDEAERPMADLPPAFSEDALAGLMVSQNGLDWRYVAEWDKWLQWDGKFWRMDKALTIFGVARNTCRQVVNFEQGNALLEGQKRTICSKRTHAAIVRVASYDERIASTSEQWDANPWVLSTPDGMVELKTGDLRPARREDYQSKITKVGPHQGCPMWLKFLEQITNHDSELQAYLQRLCGYLLTGVTTEQILAFFYGTGGNGKGVFLRTIRTIMGDYAMHASMETFTEAKGERHETELAQLRGSRFVVAQETDENRKWAESRIKALTGGDPIRARFMRQDYFEFQPAFKLIFAGNHKPALSSVDEAMRRRVHIVPWLVTIDKDQRDPLLDEKLQTESPGILQWMIEGCLLWQQAGLNPPEAVLAATEEYLESEDALQGWLDEQCEIGPEQEVGVRDLYANYVAYCEKAKDYTWSNKRLTQNLVARGMKRVKRCGLRLIQGIGLKNDSLY